MGEKLREKWGDAACWGLSAGEREEVCLKGASRGKAERGKC